ncbi:MAG: SpoIIE family protein phosphatase [Mycobacteriales bacterium]
MNRSRDEAADEVARVQVELAAAAAGVTPLAELDPTHRDLSRVTPLLAQLAAAVARLLGTDLAVVWVTDPVEDVLAASAWVGFPESYIAALRVPFGTGSAGRAVSERRIIHIEDIEMSAHYVRFQAGASEQGVRAALSVPMLTLAGEPMGALSAYYRSIIAPDEGDLELVELYARQAAEIVERARLHGQARQLAALERRRAVQLRALADSALALTAADSLDDLLRLVTDAAVEVVGCHQAVTSRVPSGWADASTYVSLSEKYAAWRDYDVVPEGRGVLEAVLRDNRPLRLTGAQLRVHPDWRGLRDAPGHPPLPDYLAAPLIGRDGVHLGIVQLSDKLDETPFTAEDEAILVQLAQMASSTIERLEAFEGERAARREAQRAAQLQGVLSDASAVFAESFEPEGIASALVRLVVPRLAEVALLHLVDESEQLVLRSCHAADSAALERMRAFFGAAPVLLDVPYGPAAVLVTGQPQLLQTSTTQLLRAVTRTEAQAVELGQVLRRSSICVPVTARGRTLGVLTLSRDETYEAGDVEHALDLARRAALALDNANRYAFERDLAVTLQRSLLPRTLPTGPAFRASARYLPGARGTQVGGDWYDLIEVGESLVLVVGDVMGRGVQAAAVMGQLQATVRAYALEGHSPAEVLTRLDRVALGVEDLHFTTCVVARLDPSTRRLCLAAAGHLAPVVVAPGGPARLLELDPGLPLGVGGAHFIEQTYDLEPGSLLMLYTDGLVECRDASISDGLDRLVGALSNPVISADEACDRVLRAMGRDGGHDDDTAVLALLLTTTPDLELRLATEASSARAARYAVRALLAQAGLDTDVAQLLVTELVANTSRYAGDGWVDVRATLRGQTVRIEVDDDSGDLPDEQREPRWERESGRGLLLVKALSQRWGVELLPTGKRVWFEVTPERTG